MKKTTINKKAGFAGAKCGPLRRLQDARDTGARVANPSCQHLRMMFRRKALTTVSGKIRPGRCWV